MIYLGGGLYLSKFDIFSILRGKVLLVDTHSVFEPVSATLLGGQKCHFWAKIRVFRPPTAILTPISVLCPNFFLALDFLGYDLLIICLGRCLSPKKPFRALWKWLFWPQIQVLKPFWPSGPIFSPKLPPKCPNMMFGYVVGSHWYPYRGPGL